MEPFKQPSHRMFPLNRRRIFERVTTMSRSFPRLYHFRRSPSRPTERRGVLSSAAPSSKQIALTPACHGLSLTEDVHARSSRTVGKVRGNGEHSFAAARLVVKSYRPEVTDHSSWFRSTRLILESILLPESGSRTALERRTGKRRQVVSFEWILVTNSKV